jgi:hypothetical protein
MWASDRRSKQDLTGNIAGAVGQLGNVLWPDFSLPKAD